MANFTRKQLATASKLAKISSYGPITPEWFDAETPPGNAGEMRRLMIALAITTGDCENTIGEGWSICHKSQSLLLQLDDGAGIRIPLTGEAVASLSCEPKFELWLDKYEVDRMLRAIAIAATVEEVLS